jgi:hypothetical protein
MGGHEGCDDSSEMSSAQVGTGLMRRFLATMSTLKKYVPHLE